MLYFAKLNKRLCKTFCNKLFEKALDKKFQVLSFSKDFFKKIYLISRRTCEIWKFAISTTIRINFCDEATDRPFENRAIAIEMRLDRWTR